MRIIAGKAGRLPSRSRPPSPDPPPTSSGRRSSPSSGKSGRRTRARPLRRLRRARTRSAQPRREVLHLCRGTPAGRHVITKPNESPARRGHAVKSEVTTFLKRDAATYDLIFADPPYWKYYGDKDHVADLLKSGFSRRAWHPTAGSSWRFPPIRRRPIAMISRSSTAANTATARSFSYSKR